MAELPSGTVTFLFTDLEGSTRLWEEHPDAMQGTLARHDAIVRGAIEGHRGLVVKTRGDGFHAVFADATDASGAAVAAQLGLSAASWDVTGPLLVRMGIHTGLAEQRDGDYYGTALNRAARLMSAAHGGQVVVSLVTGELIRDRLPDDVELLDLGEHSFRDLGRPERVFQLSHAQLRRDFPELASVDGIRGNLPTQGTSFVGRDDDLERTAALLDESHLVTLIGVGGVGKTRLALQVASQISRRFAEGAWFVDLAAVPDDESVPLAIATALGMAVTGPVLAETVVRYIGVKSLLVVLDNCEHVVDAVGELAQRLVQRCPNARLLATSREALAVDGERLWPVRPLGLPADDRDAVSSAPVQLFLDRVRALRPDFELDRGTTAAVIDICRRLDGLPLAIELAAARARSLTPHDIAERLDQRFSLLSGGKRRGVARHETLRAAVDWSYALLDDEERTVLMRVSVFAGGFTLQAAEAVAGEGTRSDDVIQTLDKLVDKSLLTVDGGRDTTRYRFFETIRQYALEKLDDVGATAAARDRHLGFFVTFARRANDGLLGPEEAEWDRRTEDELDNLRAALAWAAETDDAASALRLATAFSGQGGLRYAWGLDALATPAIEIAGAPNQPEYPLALSMAGRRHWGEGDNEAALAVAREVLALATTDTPANWEARARAEIVMGNVILTHDGSGDAADHYQRAAEYAEHSPVPSTRIIARQLLSSALPNRGAEHLEAALAEAEKSRRLALDSESPSMIALSDFSVGYALIMRDDPAAIEPLRRAAAAFIGPNQAGSLSMIALHEMRHGTLDDALNAIGAALQHARDSGDRAMVSPVIDMVWPLLIRRRDYEAAATLVGSVEEGAIPHIRRTGVPGQGRERALSRLAQQLPADEMATCRRNGAAMTYDDVVEYALARLEAARVGAEGEDRPSVRARR